LVVQIVKNFTSNPAILKSHQHKIPDPTYTQTLTFLRDVLLYLVTHWAIHYGDVRIIEHLIPVTTLRFAGG
ncbi:hypothetical protein C8Q75DRAFT_710259, partial [Abortiporus biennis]